ncbi:MAG: hypothetical protein ACK5EU_03530 [Pseudanabaena sp.]|jgi:hypothetical protein|uniref:hypothetical protein n=1 Tax=Pseudanabaena mucicola TaxID=71190 RepID=UPI00257757D6|nr:hypothetical protein [Pseudanabaena mucicola]MCA6572418.1 hypothetical protein [Pseudanabaena sp. M53BS1SP1A06MG]MCA6583035.1 hypothetical protein [Pseudanabaena sp. M34BS1SP1A06MG]MCA6587223.1 hypothetical protein [Pseudanabaena sp. M051S1SP1A06QC]MCA6589592.1 hypothetical protein [Pseudanabaena sp. M109S1SP1A06QC]MCA6591716.1 hypothetical protein [Pseudanabaena sp. M38BS1SP1A06MG]MCA6595148.1 hypothetical protein [Pseudanabaena sp. M046S1SP1A06QC]MCA6601022.1 hypothetical protein [Pseud
MIPKIQELINQAQDRYLALDELRLIESYVSSLPDRLNLYKLIRDREIDILQSVADQVPTELPNVTLEDLELGIKNLVLVLRYSSMAMLLNDENFLKERLLNWLAGIMSMRDLRRLNDTLYKLLNQALKQQFSRSQLALIQPLITTAQVTLIY